MDAQQVANTLVLISRRTDTSTFPVANPNRNA